MAKKKKSLLGQLGRAMTPLATGYALGRGVPAELLPSYQSRAEQQRRKELRQREKFAIRAEERADERQSQAEKRAIENQLDLTRRLAEQKRESLPLDRQAELDANLKAIESLQADSQPKGKKRLGRKDQQPVSAPGLSPADSAELSAAPQVSMRPDIDEGYNPLRVGLRPLIEQEAAREQFAREAAGFQPQQDPFSFLGSADYPAVDPDAAKGFEDSDDPVVIRRGLVQQSQGYKSMMDSLSPEGRGKAAERLKVIEQAKAGRPSASQELIAQLAVLEEEDPIEQYQVKTPTVQEEVESGAAFTDGNGTYIRKANGELSFNPTLRNTELKLDSQERQQRVKIESDAKSERRAERNEAFKAVADSYGGENQMIQSIKERVAKQYGITMPDMIPDEIVDAAIRKEVDQYRKTLKRYGVDLDESLEEDLSAEDMRRINSDALRLAMTNGLYDVGTPEFMKNFESIRNILLGKGGDDFSGISFTPRSSSMPATPSPDSFGSLPVPVEKVSPTEAAVAQTDLRNMGMDVNAENVGKLTGYKKALLDDLFVNKEFRSNPDVVEFFNRSQKKHPTAKGNMGQFIPMSLISSLSSSLGVPTDEAVVAFISQGNKATKAGARHLSQYNGIEQANIIQSSVVFTGDEDVDSKLYDDLAPGDDYVLPDGSIMSKDKLPPSPEAISDDLAGDPAFAMIMNAIGLATGKEYNVSKTLGKKKPEGSMGSGGYSGMSYDLQRPTGR